jgi:hypothetical protein
LIKSSIYGTKVRENVTGQPIPSKFTAQQPDPSGLTIKVAATDASAAAADAAGNNKTERVECQCKLHSTSIARHLSTAGD